MTDQRLREISLHIDRIVLKGVDLPIEQHTAFEAALVAELTELLSVHGLAASFAQGGAYPEAATGHMLMPGRLEPRQMGMETAQAIFSGLGGVGEAA
jgi:hypothetical protein